MSVEECPYCGKAFKRLKSHLPHCKMAPVAQPLKSTQASQDLPKKNAITPKQKIHKKISSEKNGMVFDERQTYKNRRKDDQLIINKTSVYNAESSLATTEVKSFERPKRNWSAKKQKEHETLQKLPVLQKSNNSTSLPDHESDESFCVLSNGQEKKSQTTRRSTQAKKKLKVAPLSEDSSITKSTSSAPDLEISTSLPSEWSLHHENPKCTVTEEIKPNNQSSDLNLVLRVKELKALSFFTSKTLVWDHIKGSLYYKRSCNLLLPGPVLGTQESSAAVQQTNNLDTTKVSSTPSVHFSETSIRRPVEDAHRLRLQSVRSLGWNPEIMTSFRILFSTEPFRNSSNDNMWKTHQFSGPSSHSKVPLIQRKLVDVRLKELGVWLGAQSPKSPKEIGTMLKQGWQWYYTRYIDVRRGGIGGISLLFAGYCVLCYVWRYPHLKKERWRKYH